MSEISYAGSVFWPISGLFHRRYVCAAGDLRYNNLLWLESPGALACCRWAVPEIQQFWRMCKRSTSLVCGVKQNHLVHFHSRPYKTCNDPGRIGLGRKKCCGSGVEGALSNRRRHLDVCIV